MDVKSRNLFISDTFVANKYYRVQNPKLQIKHSHESVKKVSLHENLLNYYFTIYYWMTAVQRLVKNLPAWEGRQRQYIS